LAKRKFSRNLSQPPDPLERLGINKDTLKDLAAMGSEQMVIHKALDYPTWAARMNADWAGAR
jgi:hypothetical protein